MTEGTLILYSSPNGRDDWTPVMPENVPEWVTDPDTLGEMVAGQIACKVDEDNPLWYRAEKV